MGQKLETSTTDYANVGLVDKSTGPRSYSVLETITEKSRALSERAYKSLRPKELKMLIVILEHAYLERQEVVPNFPPDAMDGLNRYMGLLSGYREIISSLKNHVDNLELEERKRKEGLNTMEDDDE